MSTQRIRKAVLVILVALLAFACVLGVRSILVPSYTDQQIQASLVDTWQVEAFSTAVLLVLIFLAAVFAIVLGYRGSKLVRFLASAAVLLAVADSALFVSSHIVLTARTTQITGQTFAGFYGLF
jgi:hypothetical protein